MQITLEKSSLLLKRSTSEIDLSMDVSHFYKELYNCITESVQSKAVIGVQLLHKRWPWKLQIVYANDETKQTLLDHGLRIQAKKLFSLKLAKELVK